MKHLQKVLFIFCNYKQLSIIQNQGCVYMMTKEEALIRFENKTYIQLKVHKTWNQPHPQPLQTFNPSYCYSNSEATTRSLKVYIT